MIENSVDKNNRETLKVVYKYELQLLPIIKVEFQGSFSRPPTPTDLSYMNPEMGICPSEESQDFHFEARDLRPKARCGRRLSL